jgi:hypothetical protein
MTSALWTETKPIIDDVRALVTNHLGGDVGADWLDCHVMKRANQQKGCEQVALIFLRLGGDAMRNLIGWCPETRQPVDLQLYVDDATLARIWSNAMRFRCPHCGIKHETKVERLASRPFSVERPQTKRKKHQHAAQLLTRAS